jgi:hypothetical protein
MSIKEVLISGILCFKRNDHATRIVLKERSVIPKKRKTRRRRRSNRKK